MNQKKPQEFITYYSTLKCTHLTMAINIISERRSYSRFRVYFDNMTFHQTFLKTFLVLNCPIKKVKVSEAHVSRFIFQDIVAHKS